MKFELYVETFKGEFELNVEILRVLRDYAENGGTLCLKCCF